MDGEKDLVLAVFNQTTLDGELIRLNVPNNTTGSPSVEWTKSMGTFFSPQLLLVPTETIGNTGIDIVLTFSNFTGGEMRRYLADGTLGGTTPLDHVITVSAGDIDGDGKAEIACLSGTTLTTIDGDGTVLNTLSIGSVSNSFLPMVDTDNDGVAEMVTMRKADDDGLLNQDTLVVEVLNGDLSVASSFRLPINPSGSSFRSPTVADLDNDGDTEILILDGKGSMHVADLGGTAGFYAWPQPGKYPSKTKVYEQPLEGYCLSDMSLDGDVTVTGNYAVIGKLFVGTGATIRLDASGSLGSYKEMRMIGGSTTPITIKRRGAGAWGSITASAGATTAHVYQNVDMSGGGTMLHAYYEVNLQSCSFNDGNIGIHAHNAVNVDGASFTNLVYEGIRVDGAHNDGYHVQVADASFDDVPIGISNFRNGKIITAELTGDYDKGIVANAQTNITNSQLTSSSGLGIEIPAGISVSVSNSTIDGHDGGGILCDECASTTTITDTDLSGNSTFGIKVDGVDGVLIESCELISNSATAIVCNDASTDITDCLINYNNIGILCDNYSHATISENTIKHQNYAAIKCDHGSCPVIERNTITNNGGGIFALNNANPDIGHASGGSSEGNNVIHTMSSHYVSNLSMGITIKAENNYWGVSRGTCEPKSTKIFGSVDTYPALCNAPLLSNEPVVVVGAQEKLPEQWKLGQNYPNPFNPTTQLRYEVPTPGGQVRITIYNVQGQVVRRLVDREHTPGFYEQPWNGRNDSGLNVSSGIYFARMQAPKYVRTIKLMLMK
jgi:hypothetical protein